MTDWRIVSPAPPSAALELAAPAARVRRLVLAQVRTSESAAVYRGGAVLALVMFARHGWRRVEMAMAVSPAAAPHMRRLVALAHLTLRGIADTRIVVAFVHPSNRAGARMAALTGFRRARGGIPLWVFRSDEHDATSRRTKQRLETSGGGKPQGADAGQ